MSVSRSYAGETAQARTDRRRRQLLDAGLQVLGTTGYRSATIRGICREARVADRNFYELFDSAETLLLAVYDECIARLREAVLDAVATDPAGAESADAGPADGEGLRPLARRGLDAFLAVVEDDPRLARVVWVEVLGVSDVVERTYLQRMGEFGELLVGLLPAQAPAAQLAGVHRQVLAAAVVGGISHAVTVWLAQDFREPRTQVAQALTAYLVAVADAAV